MKKRVKETNIPFALSIVRRQKGKAERSRSPRAIQVSPLARISHNNNRHTLSLT